jgi:glycosyltransferase involved in cell wall biosynthesis
MGAGTMRIGYDGKFFWQNAPFGARSGHGVHAIELLREMMVLDKASAFSVYLIEDNAELPRQDNFRYITLPSVAQGSLGRNLIAYPIELLRRPVDVLLAYSTLPAFVRCRTVLLLADIFWMANPQWLPRRIAAPRTIATRMSVRRADRVVTTTEFSKREIMRYLDVPEERIDIVPHGIRTKFLDGGEPGAIERVRERYRIGGDYVLSINDIHPRKNLVGLLTAWENVRTRTELPHKLVFVGRTLWEYPEFFSAVERSRYRDDIILPGYVEADDIGPLYRGATLFVYPSFYEGWGLQVHEAMSSATPVAIANNTTMPEISGGAAAEFDPYDIDDMADVIARVLTDAELRKQMVTRGLEQVRKYSWTEAARQTLDICYKLV